MPNKNKEYFLTIVNPVDLQGIYSFCNTESKDDTLEKNINNKLKNLNAVFRVFNNFKSAAVFFKKCTNKPSGNMKSYNKLKDKLSKGNTNCSNKSNTPQMMIKKLPKKIYLSEFISTLASYLNEKGYVISQNKITNFLKLFDGEKDISITEQKDIESAAKICFCSNPSQFENFSKDFSLFIGNYDEIQKVNELKKERSNFISSNKERKEDCQDKLKKVSNSINLLKVNTIYPKFSEIQNEAQEVKVSLEESNLLTYIDKRILDLLFTNNQELYDLYTSGQLDINIQKLDIYNLSEKMLIEGNINSFETLSKYYDLLKKVENILLETQREINSNSDFIVYQNRQKQLEQTLQELQLKENEYQNKISKIITKINSSNHREKFRTDGNAVKCLSPGELNALNKDFKYLNEQDKKVIDSYIKDNIDKFKTRIARSIRSDNVNIIDMQNTIAQACRTAGLPMNIVYQKPHMNKTNIVLVLDVSGSCSAASSLMLSFMHSLQTVFPRGCKAFAFINSLYDISATLQSVDVDMAVKAVLESIPRKGAYSNYYIPLAQLWEDYSNVITSDSIVIFIGDARNNKNETGEEYLKNISRKAKKCYWLNTEPIDEWNKCDSIIDIYSEYAKTYEVDSAMKLLTFISNM